ncbi:hydroxymethylbilane synthase [Thermoproteus tenax]|uniref:Probable porphobilinogen deaminase n=1 Tax=Thermoproteus tenax (strain ATCC 35583 / DSM 2078 / JCM 9277 / NBRC 100435 / Kra 1) TaxID=768679 RepID=G4RKU2_THETK|nr:hydroxymethylbilane synthase [Thermoproteus tenax]CCC82187.1 Porphobilinogen deaminase [Thermoproteus tenax Kra 1]
MKIRVATRGSKLSLLQTEMFLMRIKAVEPDVKFEIITVKTTGDLVQDRPLYEIGAKGIFEKEVNMALLRGDADIAIHSLKDLPSVISDELVIAGFSERETPYDVLASKSGYNIYTLPPGARVGTSSVRRAAFLKRVRPDVNIVPLRGNLDTRVGKVLNGVVDAAILAEAGLRRLYGAGAPLNLYRIRPEVIPPPPGQGIIAAVARRDDVGIIELLRRASDRRAAVEAAAERAFLKEVGAGCHTAVGGIAIAGPLGIEFLAAYASLDGRRAVFVRVFGESPEEVGTRAGRRLKEAMSSEGLKA